MADHDVPSPLARPTRWRWFRFSLRTWIIVVGVVGVVIGTQFRRAALTPANLGSLRRVALHVDSKVWQIAWSPERDRIALVGWETPVEIRDSFSLAKIETLGVGRKIIGFAFSPNKDVLAYCENNTSAVLVDRRKDRALVLDAKNAQPDLAFSPDGSLLATGGYGTDVRLWTVADGQLRKTLDVGLTPGGLTTVFSPDGKLLAVGNRNAETTVFDVATGSPRYWLPKACSHQLAFDPSGRKLAVAYVDGSIVLWNVADGKLLVERKTSAEELYAVDWSPDGSMLVTSGSKAPITIWDPGDLTVLHKIPAPPWVVAVKFSPDGLNLVCAGGSGTIGGARQLEVLGIESALFTKLRQRK